MKDVFRILFLVDGGGGYRMMNRRTYDADRTNTDMHSKRAKHYMLLSNFTLY